MIGNPLSDVHADIKSSNSKLGGIEGLRGLCIASVLVYHYWVQSLPGGFIGVSVFFTISGFVITASLLDRKPSTIRSGVTTFWLRRLRRLWPASALTLVLVLFIAHVGGWSSRAMAAESLAAFTQTYNWYVISSGAVYGQDLPSIVGHFWSLSIEMQFYLVAPLITVVLTKRRSLHILVYSAIVALSLVTSLTSNSLNFVYSSTVTRAGEIALGSLIAIARPWLCHISERRIINSALSVASFASILALAACAKYASMSTDLFASGGLLLIGLLSSVSIIGASYGRFTSRWLSLHPIRLLGAVSYSLYLVHFPILVLVIWWQVWAGAFQWVALAISLTISVLMYHFVEKPFRVQRFTATTNLLGASALAVLFVVLQVLVRAQPAIEGQDFVAARGKLSSITNTDEGPTTLPKVAVFGDSTAVSLSLGLSKQSTYFRFVGGYAELGCPVGEGGLRRGLAAYGDRATDTAWPVEDNCSRHNWIETTRGLAPVDVAIVLIGNWDIVGRRIDSLGDSFLTIDDPQYRDWLISQIEASANGLHKAGAGRVLWLTLPADTNTEHNTRLATFNELVRKVAITRPWMTIADYATYVEANPELRPDGIHLSPETSLTLVTDWLVGQIQSVVSR